MYKMPGREGKPRDRSTISLLQVYGNNEEKQRAQEKRDAADRTKTAMAALRRINADYGGKTRRRSSARKQNKSKKHHKKSKKHRKKHHNKKSKKHRKK